MPNLFDRLAANNETQLHMQTGGEPVADGDGKPNGNMLDRLAKNYQSGVSASGPTYVPHMDVAIAHQKASNDVDQAIADGAAKQRAAVLGKADSMMDRDVGNNYQMPSHPYGGAANVTVPITDSFFQTPQRGMRDMIQGVEQTASPGLKNKAAGVTKVLSGGLSAASPAMIPGALAAPLPAAIGMAGGSAVQGVGGAALKGLGVSPEYADLFAQLAGLGAGGKSAEALAGATRAPIPRFDPAKTMDASELDAVNWARNNGVPIDAATATGSKPLRNIQAMLGNMLGSAGKIAQSRQNITESLKQLGEGYASQVSPKEAIPESAGQGVADGLKAGADDASMQAGKAYARLRELEQNNTQPVSVGTRNSAIVGEDGKPVQMPVQQNMATPVDMRPVKQQLKPILDELEQQMPAGQQQFSKGLLAIKNILSGDDFTPASVADANLSAVKSIQRDAVNAKTKWLAGKVIDSASSAVDEAVAKAGPEATSALEEGRALTRAKYATQQTLESLPTEPVKVFDKLTQDRDTAVKLLLDVRQHAPNSLPAVGRAYLEGLFTKAFAEGGQAKPTTALTEWQKLGDATKNILFNGDGKLIKNLDNFFLFSKKFTENPNPSGTATLEGTMRQIRPFMDMAAAGLSWHHPIAGVTYLAGPRILARMLTNPRTAAALADGMRMNIAGIGSQRGGDAIRGSIAADRIIDSLTGGTSQNQTQRTDQ